jgi:hypothetical protein
MEKKKEKRGGARKGSGPKRKIEGETKRATFYIEVSLLEKLPANKSLFVNAAISEKLKREERL